MARRIRITTLVENTAGGVGLVGEHGLAFWIDCGRKRVLFDTGQTPAVLATNARRLDIDLARTDAVVLSHGHYDHTGGLAHVLDAAERPQVFAHPAALAAKYARNRDGTSRAIGSPLDEQAVRRRAGVLTWTAQPTDVCEGLAVTGFVPRQTGFEDTGGPFFVDPACRVADALPDDQAVYFSAAGGTVVLLGCAHAGVINTLRHVRTLTGGRPIHAVIGGMHLGAASPDRLARTIEALGEFGVSQMAPAHCTGAAATAALWSAFPGRCLACTVGTTLECDAA